MSYQVVVHHLPTSDSINFMTNDYTSVRTEIEDIMKQGHKALTVHEGRHCTTISPEVLTKSVVTYTHIEE